MLIEFLEKKIIGFYDIRRHEFIVNLQRIQTFADTVTYRIIGDTPVLLLEYNPLNPNSRTNSKEDLERIRGLQLRLRIVPQDHDSSLHMMFQSDSRITIANYIQ